MRNKTAFALWLLICGVLVLDIGQACVRAQDDAAKQIKTNRVVIVNANGNMIAEIASKNGFSGIALLDASGKPRAFLRISKYGELSFLDPTDNYTASLVGAEGAALDFANQGKTRAIFGANTTGTSRFALIDKDQHVRIEMDYDKSNDSSFFSLAGAANNVANVGATSAAEGSGIRLFDGNSKARFAMGADSKLAAILIRKPDGKTAWTEADPPSGSDSSAK